MTHTKKEFSLPLLLTQISLLTMLVVSIGVVINFKINNAFSNFEGLELLLIYIRAFSFMFFYLAAFFLLLKRKKLGIVFAIIFFLFYLMRNLYGLYAFGIDDSHIEKGGIFNITDAEMSGALFAQKYGPIMMSVLQLFFIIYFLVSKKIRRIFGLE